MLYSPVSGIVGQAFCLQVGAMAVGRDLPPEEGIGLIGDRRASRQHASLSVSMLAGKAQVLIRDEHSKNGTYLNGNQVQEELLTDGDVLRMGNSLLLLRFEPALPLDVELPLIKGRAPAICRLRHHLADAAPSSAPVLLLGEPGVGKELAARSIHERSRRHGPFLARNCAGLSDSLADSMLFGHERGAFTGATERREGVFAAAHGGTLFLDEVAELPLPVQAKLLRVLQEGEILPVGRIQPAHVDVRIVAATNRDLEKAVAEGSFRDDLYSRLRGAVITLPALRSRSEDVLPLLSHFFGDRPNLTPRLAEALLLYEWPHNVRELMQLANELRRKTQKESELDLPLIEDRLQPKARGRVHPAEQQAVVMNDSSGSLSSENTAVEGPRLTREALERLGKETNWNVSRMALAFRLSRRQLSRWLDTFGFPRPARQSRANLKDPSDSDSGS